MGGYGVSDGNLFSALTGLLSIKGLTQLQLNAPPSLKIALVLVCCSGLVQIFGIWMNKFETAEDQHQILLDVIVLGSVEIHHSSASASLQAPLGQTLILGEFLSGPRVQEGGGGPCQGQG